jgi:hypothetical protein
MFKDETLCADVGSSLEKTFATSTGRSLALLGFLRTFHGTSRVTDLASGVVTS